MLAVIVNGPAESKLDRRQLVIDLAGKELTLIGGRVKDGHNDEGT